MKPHQTLFIAPTEPEWESLRASIQSQTTLSLLVEIKQAGGAQVEKIFSAKPLQVFVPVPIRYISIWQYVIRSFYFPSAVAILFLLIINTSRIDQKQSISLLAMIQLVDNNEVNTLELIDILESSTVVQAFESVPDSDEPLTDYLNYETIYDNEI